MLCPRCPQSFENGVCPQCGRNQHRYETPVDLSRYVVDGEVELAGSYRKLLDPAQTKLDDFLRIVMGRALEIHNKYAHRALANAFAGNGTYTATYDVRNNVWVGDEGSGSILTVGDEPTPASDQATIERRKGRRKGNEFAKPGAVQAAGEAFNEQMVRDLNAKYQATKPVGLAKLIEETGIEEPGRYPPIENVGICKACIVQYIEVHEGRERICDKCASLPLDGLCQSEKCGPSPWDLNTVTFGQPATSDGRHETLCLTKHGHWSCAWCWFEEDLVQRQNARGA